MKHTATYIPQPGTMPAKVIQFFADQPGHCRKIPMRPHQRAHHLARCVEAGLLNRITNADSDMAYIASEFTPSAARRIAASVPDPVEKPKRTQRKPPALLPEIDFDQLKVGDGVKLPNTGTLKGHDKWGPVFDKLKKPGQSIELPIEARGAVGAAMSKRNRALGKRVFAIRIMSASTCRIWRVEA